MPLRTRCSTADPWPTRSRQMSGECGSDQRVEQLFVRGAVQRLHLALREDDGERRLSRYLEAGEYVAGLVVDLWEREIVSVDEILEL